MQRPPRFAHQQRKPWSKWLGIATAGIAGLATLLNNFDTIWGKISPAPPKGLTLVEVRFAEDSLADRTENVLDIKIKNTGAETAVITKAFLKIRKSWTLHPYAVYTSALSSTFTYPVAIKDGTDTGSIAVPLSQSIEPNKADRFNINIHRAPQNYSASLSNSGCIYLTDLVLISDKETLVKKNIAITFLGASGGYIKLDDVEACKKMFAQLPPPTKQGTGDLLTSAEYERKSCEWQIASYERNAHIIHTVDSLAQVKNGNFEVLLALLQHSQTTP